jgi:hypothetical protein
MERLQNDAEFFHLVPHCEEHFLSYLIRASCCLFVALKRIVSSLAKIKFKFTCMKKSSCAIDSSAIDVMQLASNACVSEQNTPLKP